MKTSFNHMKNMDKKRKALNERGLTELKPGLIVGQAKSAQGETIYLAFEQIMNQEQSDFWNYYKKQSGEYGVPFGLVKYIIIQIRDKKLPEYPNGFSAMFKNEEEYKQITDALTQRFQAIMDSIDEPDEKRRRARAYRLMINPITEVPAGSRGFDVNLRENSDHLNFVVYASKEPIEDYRYLKPVIDTDFPDDGRAQREHYAHGQHYHHNYSDILMSVSSHTAKDSPSFTHMGIFRNPFGFLDPNHYKGIGMILHGFAAEVESSKYERKLMMNEPTPFMAQMLVNTLGDKNVITNSRTNWENDVKQWCQDENIKVPNDVKSLDHCIPPPSLFVHIKAVVKLKDLAQFYQDARPELDQEMASKPPKP